jgi:sporulation protein YlmC with PRC-barrel domain
MKRFLMTTALVAFASAPVFAQTSTDAPAVEAEGHEMSMQAHGGIFLAPSGETTIYGSEFLGKTVYATDHEDGTRQATVDGVPDGWENVATVDDVLMTRDGEIRGILVDVGGFLGIGARTVALDMSALDIVYDREGDDFYVVFTSTRDELEAAPEYDRTADIEARTGTWDMARDQDAAPQPATDTMAQDPTADPAMSEQPTADADGTMAAPREGFAATAHGELSVDDLKAADVFDSTDERIAGVSDVLVTEDGAVTNIIVDVGGFLGIGAKSVAIDYNQVELFRGTDRDELRVYVPMTREQLEDMPEYEG